MTEDYLEGYGIAPPDGSAYSSNEEYQAAFDAWFAGFTEDYLEGYVFGQAGASIYTYIQCLGWAKFWNQMREMKRHEERLSIKQRELIEEWTGKNPKKMALEYDEKEPEMRMKI